MNAEITAAARRWAERIAGEELLCELRQAEKDEKELEDRFYRELEFGTGGLRGVLGVGSNRMNVYTVGKASQGYARYLLDNFTSPSVAISYDSRIHSQDFACAAAEVFGANGVSVFLYPRLMPTPALSFAVRDLRCSGGVMITASHNPAKYNGYKVYGADGCQITAGAAAAIQREINRADIFDGVLRRPFAELLEEKIITYIGEDTVDRFLAAAMGESLLPEGIDRDISIVYTPLNGAGISCVPAMLRARGFTNFTIPPEQAVPDGRFPTCPSPNPEIREALELGLRCAEKTGSDLLLATDPDCDRVGIAVRDENGCTLLNGNETGVLLLDFICRMRTERGTMPKNPVMVKTIVTTAMGEAIADHYGVETVNVLTGFKYIGEQIALLEKKGEKERYIFGFEESCGYLSGSFVRDKDAVSASLLICEMFLWHRSRGKSLVQALNELYEQYGYYRTQLLTYTFEGAAGLDKMQKKMAALRLAPPKEIAGYPVSALVDYEAEGTGLPRSDVLRFLLENGEAVVRPSGTEPKLKVYLTLRGGNAAACSEAVGRLSAFFDRWAGEQKE